MRSKLTTNRVFRTLRRFIADISSEESGYLLPAVIVLGLAIGTVSIAGLQSVAQNSTQLTGQDYTIIAREAAKAGIAAAAKCLDKDTVWTGQLVSTTCTGGGTALTVINTDAYTSTFSVNTPDKTTQTNAYILTSTGTVNVKGPSNTTVSTESETVRAYGKITSVAGPRVGKKIGQVATGNNTTCAVTNDAAANDYWAYCWGDDTSYQVGAGPNLASDAQKTPKAVANNAAIIPAVTAQPSGCGPNFWQTACTVQAAAAVPASAMAGKSVVKVSVGMTHTCAIAKNAGDTASTTRKAYCWGDNTTGQLGNRTTASSSVPVAVDILPTAYTPPPVTPSPCGGFLQPSCTPVVQPTQLASALGNPADPTNGKTVTDITAGNGFTCALTSDGTVACWGENGRGQLGTNNTTDYTYPQSVYKSDFKAGTPAVTHIPSPCGGFFQPSCTPIVDSPAVPDAPATALWGKSIAKLGEVRDGATMCAMDTNNEGYCWGENNVGQTGSDTHSPNTYTTSSGSSGPSGGNRSSKCSGHTGSGSGTTALSWTATSYPAKQPIAVVGGQTFTDIIVNGDYVTAKTAAGNSNKAYWWGGESSYTYSKSCSTSACGSNSSGNQWCADWDTTYTYTYVSHPPTGPLYTSSPISGGQFSSLSGDAYTGYFCGVTGSDIYCDTHGPTYGQGQLGNGVTATCSTSCTPSYTTPQIVSTSQVLSPASWLTSGMNIIGLNLGANHACAITDTTTTGSYIGCWGYNASGQIGNNATANRFYPTAVDISTNSDLGTESATTTYDISNFVYL